MNRRRLLIAAGIGLAALVVMRAAVAATAGPSNFTVATTLTNLCTVSATNVSFGSVGAGVAAANTAGRVTLTCNKGATVSSVALNNGANASGTQKRMLSSGGEFLNYRIDRPTGATFNTCPTAGAGPEWNATNTIAATTLFATTGGAKLINVCASIPAGQFPAAGAYTDTVQVTATYN